MARAQTNIGLTYAAIAEDDKAISAERIALTTFHQLGDKDGEARVQLNLGLALTDTGDVGHALVHYRTALTLFEELRETAQAREVRKLLGRATQALKNDRSPSANPT